MAGGSLRQLKRLCSGMVLLVSITFLTQALPLLPPPSPPPAGELFTSAHWSQTPYVMNNTNLFPKQHDCADMQCHGCVTYSCLHIVSSRCRRWPTQRAAGRCVGCAGLRTRPTCGQHAGPRQTNSSLSLLRHTDVSPIFPLSLPTDGSLIYFPPAPAHRLHPKCGARLSQSVAVTSFHATRAAVHFPPAAGGLFLIYPAPCVLVHRSEHGRVCSQIWRDSRGNFHAVFHDHMMIGGHSFSRDGEWLHRTVKTKNS